MTARHVLEFTRSAQADRGAAQLPEGDVEYQLRADGQQRPDLCLLRWSPRLLELLDALRDQGDDGAGEAAARVGRVLAEFVATPGWAVAARAVAADAERGLTALSLRSNASELYLLPWELLALGAVAHAAFLPALLLRYEWPDAPVAPRLPGLSLTRRGRVVFAWSAAGGKVDAARHVKLVERAIDAGAAAFDEERGRSLDVVENASCESLRAALERAKAAGDPVAVLHLLCHGGRRADGSFGLCLDDGDAPGEVDLVSASRMQQLLVPYAGLVRLVVVAACDGGNAGAAGHELGSVAQSLHRAGMPAVVASRFPLSWDGARLFATELYDRMLRDLGTLEEAFLAARARLSRRPAFDWASLQLYARASDGEATRVFTARPYRGLAAFGPEHARFFFGRDAEVAEVVGDLDALVAKGRPRFLVVAGASGTGKSSMVMAGALPRWAREQTDGSFGHVVVRPGGDLEGCLRRIEAKREVAAACARFVVVVDQFEEVFTHVGDLAARTTFARALWEMASEPDASVCVVLTLRVDFLARCGEIVLDESGLRLDRIACDPAHQILVAQMTPAQLREAIERPAAAVGLALEPNLAELIVRDVEAEPGALPLMSHALYLLWLGREGPTLTRAAYLRLGSVQGALNTHADAQVEALADDAAREVARRLLVRLVRPGEGGAADTRRRRGVDALRPAQVADGQRFDAVLERLVGARLLVTSEGDGGARMVEIAHEALIRGWSRLRGWIDGERVKLAQLDQLDVWVGDWQRTSDALLTGARLGYAEEVARQHEAELSPEARQLVAESVAARAQAQARKDRARRAQWVVAAGVGAALAGFAVFAGAQWRAARGSARTATMASEQARREALAARTLAEVSRASELRSRLESGGAEREVLADALQFWDEARGASAQRGLLRVLRRAAGDVGESARTRAMRPLTPDVGGALTQAALAAAQRMELRGHAGPVTAVRWSADGRRLLTTSDDSTARVWNATTGEALATIAGEGRHVWRVAWAPDGAQVIVGWGDDAWRWSAPGEAHVPLFTSTQREPLNTYGLAVSGDGRHAVILVSEAREDHGLWMHQRQLVRVIATETGATVATLDAGRFEVDSLPVVSWDGAMVVLRSNDGRARVWRTGEDAAATLEGGARGRVVRVAVSRDGARAVTVSEGGALTLWDTASGRVVGELPHTGAVPCVAFAPDGASVVVGLSGGPSGMALGVWRGGDGGWRSLAPGDAEVRSLHASEDGGRLATTHADGTAAVWSLPSGTRLLRVQAAGKAFTDAALSPDGGRLATACDDRTAAVWTIRPTGTMLAPLDADAPVTGLTFSADGARLAVTTDAAPVRVWDLRERTPPLALRGDGAMAPRVQFTPGGAQVLTLREDGVGVWSARDGARVAWRTADHGDAVDWSVSADARVASRLDDRRVAVWRLGDDSAPVELAAVRPSVSRALVSPDGALVATLHADHVSIWSATDGRLVATLAGGSTSARAITFSPDGTTLLTGDRDGMVRVSGARSGRLVRTLRGHTEAITALVFSTDGALLATASVDGAMRLWDGHAGAPRATLHGHDGEVRSLVFSPDHARLFTVGANGVARAWSTDDGRLSGLLRWRGERAREGQVAADGLHAAVVYAEGAAEFVDLDPVAAWRSGCAILRDGPIWRDRPRLRDACAGASP